MVTNSQMILSFSVEYDKMDKADERKLKSGWPPLLKSHGLRRGGDAYGEYIT